MHGFTNRSNTLYLLLIQIELLTLIFVCFLMFTSILLNNRGPTVACRAPCVVIVFKGRIFVMDFEGYTFVFFIKI